MAKVTVYTQSGKNVSTFVKQGTVEINFKNGVALVEEDEAKELLARDSGMYYGESQLKSLNYDSNSPGSFAILDAEFRKLLKAETVIKLKKWLIERGNEIEPAVTALQRGVSQVIEVPEQTFQSPLPEVPKQPPTSVDGNGLVPAPVPRGANPAVKPITKTQVEMAKFATGVKVAPKVKV